MSYDAPITPTLFDLIAREWILPGPIDALCFNQDISAIAFAGDFGLGIAPIADPERPETRIRVAADTGRATIQPRRSPVRPLVRVEKTTGPVVAFGAKSFVTGAARGGLVSVTPRGQDVPLATPLTAVTALARDPASSGIAAAEGNRVTLLTEAGDPASFDLPTPVSALAFAPRGGDLAVGQGAGVTLRAADGSLRDISLGTAPTALRWSADGACLACGFDTPGVALIRVADGAVDWRRDYPTPTRAIGFGHGTVATSGAFRLAAWQVTPAGLGTPIEAGKPGLVVVERIALCPDRPLIASGYANGLVCIAKLGTRDEMLLRNDGAAITALDWSADGAHLALGCADGTAALVTFPPNMFK